MIDSLLSSLPPARTNTPTAIVLHQTGEHDLDKIIRYYSTNAERVAPHYLVETTGSVRRFVPEDHVAYHAGMKAVEARLYRRGYQEWSHWLWNDGDPQHQGIEQPNYRAWRDQWVARGLTSPLELPTGDHPNSVSVGIEIQKPAYARAAFFEPEQYEAAARLVLDIGKRHGISVDRQHVLHHYDVSPLRRSNSKGPWDLPASFSYNALWDAM